MTLEEKAALTKKMAERAAVRRAVAQARQYRESVAAAVSAATSALPAETTPLSTAVSAPAPAMTPPVATAETAPPPRPLAVAATPSVPPTAAPSPALQALTARATSPVAAVPTAPAQAPAAPPASGTGSHAPATLTVAPTAPGTRKPRASAGTGTQTRGKGRSWTLDERKALAKAYAVATLNGVAGTDQTKDEFWDAVHEGYVSQCPSGQSSYALAGRWRNRTASAAMTEFVRNVGPCSQRFAHFYYVARSDKLTGNLDEESVLSAARALYSASSAYSAVRKDSEEEEKLKKAGKAPPQRRARMVPENWQPCWEELRVLDKWSGAAANPDIAAVMVAQSGEGNNGAGAGGGAGRSTWPALQGAPMGHKAAKRLAAQGGKSDEQVFARAMEKSNDAIMTIAQSISKRTETGEAAQEAANRRIAAEYFQQEGVRDTPEAKAFQEELHKEMLEVGRAALQSSRKRRLDGAASASSGADVVTAEPPPCAPQDKTAVTSRGANSFATKAKRAMSQGPTIDLTVPPVSMVVTEVGDSETEDGESESDTGNLLKSSSSGDDESTA